MTTSVSSLRISGLASGMDVDSMVTKMMSAQRMKVDTIKQNKQVLAWQQEDYRSINSTLRTFRDELFNMKLQSTYMARKATSSNESVVKATANTSAVEGTYDLSVSQMAKNASITSDQLASSVTSATKMSDLDSSFIGTTVTIANGSKSAELVINAGDTISTVVNNINNLKATDGSSLGIKVSFDDKQHRFFMLTNATGSDQGITLTDDAGSFLKNELGFSQLTATGDDALVTLNNASLAFSSNQFTVSGITYSLQGKGESSVLLSKDVDSVVNSIKDFVSKYNDTISKLNDKLDEERYSDYLPLTDDQKSQLSDTQQELWETKAKSGLLRKDQLLQSVVNNMRSSLSASVSGMGTSQYTTLSSIGITTGSYTENGKLYIDETELRDALNNDPDAVKNLFTKSSDSVNAKGLAARLYDNVNNALTSISKKAGSADSLVDSSSIGDRLKEFTQQISDWDDRLQSLEERYYKQFSAMETAMEQLNSQSNWLTQQFST